MTESETVIETVTEMILVVGMEQECLEDTETVPGVERGTRNGKGTEIIETDTTDFVSVPLIYTTFTF